LHILGTFGGIVERPNPAVRWFSFHSQSNLDSFRWLTNWNYLVDTIAFPSTDLVTSYKPTSGPDNFRVARDSTGTPN
jgi:hypothetical protein